MLLAADGEWELVMDSRHLQYQLKAGHYCLYDLRDAPCAVSGERRFRLRTALVAIAFDVVTGNILEHGSAARINAWALGTRRRLRMAGQDQAANRVVVVSGPLPVEEINKCLSIRGYCLGMLRKLAQLPHGKSMQTWSTHQSNDSGFARRTANDQPHESRFRRAA